jgi:hypothetical protein
VSVSGDGRCPRRRGSSDAEVASLIEVLTDKSPASLLCTKYFADKGADLDMWSSSFFEAAPPQEPFGAGCASSFVDNETREARRRLTMAFRQD